MGLRLQYLKTMKNWHFEKKTLTGMCLIQVLDSRYTCGLLVVGLIFDFCWRRNQHRGPRTYFSAGDTKTCHISKEKLPFPNQHCGVHVRFLQVIVACRKPYQCIHSHDRNRVTDCGPPILDMLL